MGFDTLTWRSDTHLNEAVPLKKLCRNLYGLLDTADLVYSLEYEALGMNPMFLDSRLERDRHIPGEIISRRRVWDCLRGSSLWKSENGTLSGAISMKSGCAVHGTVRDAAAFLEDWVKDNERTPEQLFVSAGLSIALDMAKLSLAHLSRVIACRLLRLTNPVFSGLPEFLGWNAKEMSKVQAQIKGIDAQINHLSSPHGLYHQALLNEAADLDVDFSNAFAAAERMIDLLFILLALETAHCMKIFELRRTQPSGARTAILYGQVKKDAGNVSSEAIFIKELIINLAGLLKANCQEAGFSDRGGEAH